MSDPFPATPLTAEAALAELRRRHALYVKTGAAKFSALPFTSSAAVPGWVYFPLEDRVATVTEAALTWR